MIEPVEFRGVHGAIQGPGQKGATPSPVKAALPGEASPATEALPGIDSFSPADPEERSLNELLLGVKKRASALPVSQIETLPGGSLKTELEGLSTRLLLGYTFYSQLQPGARKLTGLLRRLTGDPEVCAFVYKDGKGLDPNAFALPTKEILVSETLLGRFTTQEGPAALARHELTHVEKGHGESLYMASRLRGLRKRLAVERRHEAEADISMLLGLDEEGINPIGAFECFDLLFKLQVEEKKKYEALDEFDVDLGDLLPEDVGHGGSAEKRGKNLRELLRFLDLRNLKPEGTPMNWKELLSLPDPGASYPLTGLAETLSPNEFWRQISVGRTHEDKKPLIGRFVNRHVPDLSPSLKESLTTYLHEQICSGHFRDQDYFSPETFQEVVGGGAFNRLGITLLESDLLKLSRSLFRQSLAADSPGRAKRAREALADYRRIRFGDSSMFLYRLDTEFSIAFLEEKGATFAGLEKMLEGMGAGYVNEGQAVLRYLDKNIVEFDELTGFYGLPEAEEDHFKTACAMFERLFRWNQGIKTRREGRDFEALEFHLQSLADFQHAFDRYSYLLEDRLYIYKRFHLRRFTEDYVNLAKEKIRDESRFLRDLLDYAKRIRDPFERTLRIRGVCKNYTRLGIGKSERQFGVQMDIPAVFRGKREIVSSKAHLLINALIADRLSDLDSWLLMPDSKKKRVPLDSLLSRIKFAREVLAKRAEMGLVGKPPAFEGAARGELRRVGAVFKEEYLTRLAQMDPPSILQQAPEMIERWPVLWVGMEAQNYEAFWKKISGNMIDYLKAHPEIPNRREHYEGLLCLTFMTQGSLSATSAASFLLSEWVSSCPSFHEAFLVFQKYGYLPFPVLKPAFAILQERAVKPAEIASLTDFALEALKSEDAGEKLVLAEIGGWLSSKIPAAEREPIFMDLLLTNETDVKFKRDFMEVWWRGLSSLGGLRADLGANLAFPAWVGERKPDPKKFAEAFAYAKTKPSLFSRPEYVSFDEVYQSLFRLDQVTKYLVLRQFALEGEGAVFVPVASRRKILEGLLLHYMGIDSQTVRENPTSLAIFNAVLNIPTPDEIFYYGGPFLSELALQIPRQPESTEQAAEWLYRQKVDPEFRKSYPGFDKLANAQLLTKSRLRTLVTGILPDYSLDPLGSVQVKWPANGGAGTHLEDFLLAHRFAPLLERGRAFEGKVSGLDVVIKFAEFSGGALAKRTVQFYGLYNGNLSPEERLKVDRIYDRAAGQEKVFFKLMLDREAGKSPKLRSLVNEVATLEDKLGGGSLVTVFRVKDTSGRSWAVGILNPNVKYLSHDLLKTAKPVFDQVARDLPHNPTVQLVDSLLDKGYEWVVHEIEDPRYIERNARFYLENDYRSQADPFESPPGIPWRIRVPEIRDTGTDYVRWEECIEGSTVARCVVGPAGSATELNRRPPRVSPEDAKFVAALISRNFAHQLLEKGLVHSNITPGQFVLTENREVAILDRKGLLVLNPEERQGLLMPIVSAVMSGRQDLRDVIQAFLSAVLKEKTDVPQLMKELEGLVSSPENERVEDMIGRSLAHLHKRGIDLPLKWLLILQDFLGCNRICEWAKGEAKDSDFNLLKALTFGS